MYELVRLEEQRNRFVEGRQPSGAAVFFTRGVIEALLKGIDYYFASAELFAIVFA